MPFFGTKFGSKLGTTLTSLALVCLLGTAARADDVRATYDKQIGYALHLLEAGRYGEASDAAQALVTAQPDAALPYALRGTCALYVGSMGRAQADFDHAANISDEPVALYGKALTLLTQHKSDAARTALTDVAKDKELSPEQAEDVETLRAYVQLLDGDAAGAAAISGKEGAGKDDKPGSARAEIAAIATYRADPKAGTGPLRAFLVTPTGVPRVQEAEGMRLLFDSSQPLEAAVTEPELQRMYADRINGALNDAARTVGTVRACAGETVLAPTETLPANTALVSYAVDGQMAAMVGSAVYVPLEQPQSRQWHAHGTGRCRRCQRKRAAVADADRACRQSERRGGGHRCR